MRPYSPRLHTAEPVEFANGMPSGAAFDTNKLPFAEPSSASYSFPVSTLVEIQDAVARLREDEKRALALWLNSQIEPEMSAQEEQRLLRSLDEAIRDVDAGKGVPMEDVRQRVALWAAK